jgi:hypothetical protein
MWLVDAMHIFARKKCISPQLQLFQNENICEESQCNEQPVIAHFRRKRVIGARGDFVLPRTPTKSDTGKLYRKSVFW